MKCVNRPNITNQLIIQVQVKPYILLILSILMFEGLLVVFLPMIFITLWMISLELLGYT